MSKNKNKSAVAPAADNTASTSADPTPAPAKKTKAAAPVIELTEAQKHAAALLEKANAEALAELKKNSQPKLDAAQKKVDDAKAVLKAAQTEQRALFAALGLKPAKSAGVPKSSRIGRYHFVSSFPEGKGAPQARQILSIIEAGGKTGLTRDEVVEKMSGVVTTTMPLARLLSYYTKPLVDAGHIRTEDRAE